MNLEEITSNSYEKDRKESPSPWLFFTYLLLMGVGMFYVLPTVERKEEEQVENKTIQAKIFKADFEHKPAQYNGKEFSYQIMKKYCVQVTEDEKISYLFITQIMETRHEKCRLFWNSTCGPYHEEELVKKNLRIKEEGDNLTIYNEAGLIIVSDEYQLDGAAQVTEKQVRAFMGKSLQYEGTGITEYILSQLQAGN